MTPQQPDEAAEMWRKRAEQAEAALREIAHFKFDVMRSPALDLHDVKAIADTALSAGDKP